MDEVQVPAVRPDSRTVLVVGGGMVVGRLVGRVLSEAGHRVLRTETGREARERFRTSCPHAVLVDLDLACSDGASLLHFFHETQPGVPVVLLADRLDYRHITEALRSGAHDYIEAPFDPENLRAVVERASRAAVHVVPSNREILLVDPDPAASALESRLKAAGYSPFRAEGLDVAREVVGGFDIDVAIAGPGADAPLALDLISLVREQRADVPVIVLSQPGQVSFAVQCLRSGAFEVSDRALTDEEVLATVRRAYDRKSLADARRKRDHERQIYDAKVEQLGQELEAMVEARTRELVRQKRLSEQILSSIPSGVLLVDFEGTVNAVNPAAVGILRLEGQPVVGRRVVEIPAVTGFADEICRTVEEKSPIPRAEKTVRLADGAVRTIGYTLVPLVSDGGPCLGAVLHIKDITALKDMEDRRFRAYWRRASRLAWRGRRACDRDRRTVAEDALDRGRAPVDGVRSRP